MFIDFLETITLEATYVVLRDRLAAEGRTLTRLQFLQMPLNRRLTTTDLIREIAA